MGCGGVCGTDGPNGRDSVVGVCDDCSRPDARAFGSLPYHLAYGLAVNGMGPAAAFVLRARPRAGGDLATDTLNTDWWNTGGGAPDTGGNVHPNSPTQQMQDAFGGSWTGGATGSVPSGAAPSTGADLTPLPQGVTAAQWNAATPAQRQAYVQGLNDAQRNQLIATGVTQGLTGVVQIVQSQNSLDRQRDIDATNVQINRDNQAAQTERARLAAAAGTLSTNAFATTPPTTATTSTTTYMLWGLLILLLGGGAYLAFGTGRGRRKSVYG